MKVTPIKLNNNALTKISPEISVPNYDRSKLTAGIVHIGLGNFHRAHQSWYLHRLMQQNMCHDWAIIGAGVRPYDQKMREKLLEQDCLTTLIELDPTSTSSEVVGSMIDYLPIEEDNASLINVMAQENIRIVSLTVTESGYFIDPATGEFDSKHADIQFDIKNPKQPKTAFGAIIAALKIRREQGKKPFTIQSCDNLQGNGDITKQVVIKLAQLIDGELADWIAHNCTFPNSMVDCIVPATGDKELALVTSFGIDDSVPVSHENFRQWVIEDNFCNGRPEWEKVGATFTKNVHAYEAMKIRMLNAGHQILVNAGELLALETISQCMENELIAKFFQKVAMEEIAPHVTRVPNMTPASYLELISRRFANPKIVDTVRRVAYDGSSRHPGFIFPTIREALDKKMPIDGLALVEALWARMCMGEREDGSIIEANDPQWDMLVAAAIKARSNPQDWLRLVNAYGDLGNNQNFIKSFEYWLNYIYEHGVEKTLQHYLKDVDSNGSVTN